MKITEGLLGEHAVFYAQFDHLYKTIPEAGSTIVVRSLTSLLTSALATHAQLENTVLFPALETHLPPNGPLAVMRDEHEEIEGNLQRLMEIEELGEAQNLFLQTLEIARSHFAKEEQILFPMAEQILGVEKLNEIGATWMEQRNLQDIPG